jgi:transcriptional regulator with XRE-family HTH domain
MRNQAEYYRQLGRRIQRARLRQGLTQEELAKLIGLSRTSMVNVERGRQKVLAHTLIKLGRVLKVSLEELAQEPSAALKIDDLLDNLSETAKQFVRSAVTPLKQEK